MFGRRSRGLTRCTPAKIHRRARVRASAQAAGRAFCAYARSRCVFASISHALQRALGEYALRGSHHAMRTRGPITEDRHRDERWEGCARALGVVSHSTTRRVVILWISCHQRAGEGCRRTPNARCSGLSGVWNGRIDVRARFCAGHVIGCIGKCRRAGDRMSSELIANEAQRRRQVMDPRIVSGHTVQVSSQRGGQRHAWVHLSSRAPTTEDVGGG